MSKSDEQVAQEFDEAVNMSRKELEEWLETDVSKEVGQKDGGNESKGHESGRRIVEILGKDNSDYNRGGYRAHETCRQLRPPSPGPAAQRRCRGLQLALLTYELGSRPLEVASQVYLQWSLYIKDCGLPLSRGLTI